MFTKHSDGSISCAACVRAIDLIRIADQMMKENMKYTQVRVFFDDNRDDYDGLIKISAIPSSDSDDVKIYPPLKGMLTIEIDDDPVF